MTAQFTKPTRKLVEKFMPELKKFKEEYSKNEEGLKELLEEIVKTKNAFLVSIVELIKEDEMIPVYAGYYLEYLLIKDEWR